MTRTISVSTATFAAIWAARREGEPDEDAVLKRLLGVAEADDHSVGNVKPTSNGKSGGAIGFRDARNGVDLKEGFEIFRSYKGTEFRAVATGGTLLLIKTGQRFASLNRLSQAIHPKRRNENAWENWFFRDSADQRRPISELRDPSRIIRRKTLDDFDFS